MVNQILPIQAEGEIDPAFLALVEEGARAVHPDIAQFLVETGKKIGVESLSYDGRHGEFRRSKATAVIFQDTPKYCQYTGDIRRIRTEHPQRSLFHELIHALDAELGLSSSKEFIACYNADGELAKQNGTYEKVFLTLAPHRGEDAHRGEVLAYCAEWQSSKGEPSEYWTKPSWSFNAQRHDQAHDYRNIYPSCWDLIAKNAPSIDHGFANLAPRAPDAVSHLYHLSCDF